MADAQRRAARISARAEISDVRLLNAKVEIVRLPGLNAPLAYNLDLKPVVEYEEGSSSFVVRAAYQLLVAEQRPGISDPFETNDTAIANIEFELAGLFMLHLDRKEDPPSPSELEAYAESTGQIALYPFAREYIYDITGRMALPPLTIGVLKVREILVG